MKTFTSQTSEYDEIQELINNISDDYIEFYVFNNQRASIRLRKDIKEIVEKLNDMSHDILETKKFRNEFGYKIPKRRRNG